LRVLSQRDERRDGLGTEGHFGRLSESGRRDVWFWNRRIEGGMGTSAGSVPKYGWKRIRHCAKRYRRKFVSG